MAVQTFNTDIVKKLDAVEDVFRDDLFKKMRTGLENAKECAVKSNAPKLIRSCDAAISGSESMIKVFESVLECIDRYKEQIKRTESAFE